ncbi:MAG: PH domain-containing protein [Candidatus Sumerlaeota bacterium]|nr:PH domain-containing protein [Candidatus Sumerlaeota bacterium]
MYELLKSLVLSLLKCPAAPPAPPAGSHDLVRVFRAARAYLHYRLLGFYIFNGFLTMALLLAIVVFVAALHVLGLLIGLLIAIAVALEAAFFYVVVRLDYEMRYYIITDRSLRIREGVWMIREITLTFDNIQNFNIQQGPLQRLFGIYNLVVETAGGGGNLVQKDPNQFALMLHQGVFRGIDNPQEIRDLIMGYLRSTRSSGLGDAYDVAAASPAAPAPSASCVLPAKTALGIAWGSQEMEALRAIAAEANQLRKQICGG